MKKIFGVLMMCLMLFSMVAVAFAQGNEDAPGAQTGASDGTTETSGTTDDTTTTTTTTTTTEDTTTDDTTTDDTTTDDTTTDDTTTDDTTADDTTTTDDEAVVPAKVRERVKPAQGKTIREKRWAKISVASFLTTSLGLEKQQPYPSYFLARMISIPPKGIFTPARSVLSAQVSPQWSEAGMYSGSMTDIDFHLPLRNLEPIISARATT